MNFVSPQSLTEQVADYIREKIITMELKPGEFIREAKVAQDLNISRSPIREALKILERQKLVEQIPRKGTKVTEISKDQIDSLYEVTLALITHVAKKCVEKATSGDLKVINQAAEKATQAVKNQDMVTYYQAIFEFALACIKATQNTLLEEILYDLFPNLRRIQFQLFKLRSNNLEENLKIFKKGNYYVQHRNAEMSANTVIEYMENEKKLAMQAIENGNLALDKQEVA